MWHVLPAYSTRIKNENTKLQFPPIHRTQPKYTYIPPTLHNIPPSIPHNPHSPKPAIYESTRLLQVLARSDSFSMQVNDKNKEHTKQPMNK